MNRRRDRTTDGRLLPVVVALGLLGMLAYVMHDLTGDVTPGSVVPAAPGHYLTASGREVTLQAYQGQYLWVDHAAAWCGYCEPQTRTLVGLEQRYGDRLAFLTVVTGTDQVMQPPTAATARAWADRFGLDPERVLARFTTDTLPYHVLYSPRGEVLYQGSGLYDTARIIEILRMHHVL